MYVIISGDGKEYGPVSGAVLRQWISEERLNAQSLIKAEGDAEFRPLCDVPGICRCFGNYRAYFETRRRQLGSAGIGSREMASNGSKFPPWH